jgi:hypothetical protein
MNKLPQDAVEMIALHQRRVMPLRDCSSVSWLVSGRVESIAAERAGVVAWYDARRDAVVIPAYLADMAGEVVFAPTITHELTHAYQRSELGLVRYLINKLLMRHKLEAEAEREELRAVVCLRTRRR